MKVSANWLKDFVTLNPPFEKIAEDLTLAGLEVKKVEPVPGQKDHLFEIEITSNRPDWLSHIGVAREIAAAQNLSFKAPEMPKVPNRPMPQGWKINLKDQEACPYYTGVYIEGVQNLATPDFMKDRLAACGIRSISLIVDITNYVLLETGQPLHAFDADLLSGQEIQVRRAKAEEKFTAINGQAYPLASHDLVIGDSEKAVALAGVMGGKDTEVSARTRNIFLESAFFHPRFVRHTSRRLNLSSDSSYRFERRVDPEGVDYGRERAIALIEKYAKPRFISAVVKAGQKPVLAKPVIHLSVQETVKKLGAPLKQHQILSILNRLGFDSKQDSAESVKVHIPSFRADVTEPVDLIEEVARIYGFENIPETLPVRAPAGVSQSPLYRLEEDARNYCAAAGCYETVTFSLISTHGLDAEKELAQAVGVNNPQNQELSWMRPFFWPSFCQVIQKNLSWGAQRIPVFEIANLYHWNAAKKSITEQRWLGIALAGKFREKSWLDSERNYSFYDLKGILSGWLEHAGAEEVCFREIEKSFLINPGAETITVNGEVCGYVGEIHPRKLKHWDVNVPVYFAEVCLENVLTAVSQKRIFAEIPKYPSITRDLSVTVADSVNSGVIEEEIKKLGKGIVTHVELFDLFRGGRVPKGYKNLAYRVIYQSLEKTLLSEDIQKVHSGIAARIVEKYQASFQ